mmetsp:Transcript_27521/g.107788  ORF Transcript_27521/g.107788 Transcript_27521/m.107788 type:complete len:91 (+) Transcript_27521:1577-1849(+)
MVFGLMSTKLIFMTCGLVSLLGALTTGLFTADVRSLELSELDKWHEEKQFGKGVTSSSALPENLSIVERLRGQATAAGPVYEPAPELSDD